MALTFDLEKIEQFYIFIKPMIFLMFSMFENANQTFLMFDFVHLFSWKIRGSVILSILQKIKFHHCCPTD